MRGVGKSLKSQTSIYSKSPECFLNLQRLKKQKSHLPHLPEVGVLLLPIRSAWKMDPRLGLSALFLLANSEWTHWAFLQHYFSVWVLIPWVS